MGFAIVLMLMVSVMSVVAKALADSRRNSIMAADLALRRRGQSGDADVVRRREQLRQLQQPSPVKSRMVAAVAIEPSKAQAMAASAVAGVAVATAGSPTKKVATKRRSKKMKAAVDNAAQFRAQSAVSVYMQHQKM